MDILHFNSILPPTKDYLISISYKDNVKSDITLEKNRFLSCSLYKCKTVSMCILIITILYFYMELIVSIYLAPSSFFRTLYILGAKFTPAIVYRYEIYRILLPSFLHGSFSHLLQNSLVFFLLAFPIECETGKWYFLIIYFGSSIYGWIISSIMLPEALGLGASTGVLGLGGSLVSILIINFHKFNHKEKGILFINALSCFSILYLTHIEGERIDDPAHYGGFFFGLFITFALLIKKKKGIVFFFIKIFSILFCIVSPVLLIIYLFSGIRYNYSPEVIKKLQNIFPGIKGVN